ncbi:hypothetical protein [Arenibacter certesii]|uniref:Uncharacterized protein n=1 Tax=Arenibacter certesii TaxID=228955 RepID=A0A918IPX1_9FLAO|nr:hypothetical protein [Arenibacter certesii]GGW26234.1 hypothetical protein GCM10007383_09080 [Arenibacter certesii]
MIKKIGKFLLVAFILLLVVAGTLFALLHESRPQNSPSIEADALASKMLTALNYEAYKNTRFLEWSFTNNKHHYLWDKQENLVEVNWDAYTVILNLKVSNLGEALKNGEAIVGEEKKKIMEKARTYFNNDSFWLVAPYKVFDKGTQRSLVPFDNETYGLLVTYTTGGDTPGDSYLWVLDEEGIPQSFKMWVKIIPIGGLEATWEGWQVMDSGALLPASHQLGPFNFSMGEVKGFNSVIEN